MREPREKLWNKILSMEDETLVEVHMMGMMIESATCLSSIIEAQKNGIEIQKVEKLIDRSVDMIEAMEFAEQFAVETFATYIRQSIVHAYKEGESYVKEEEKEI